MDERMSGIDRRCVNEDKENKKISICAKTFLIIFILNVNYL